MYHEAALSFKLTDSEFSILYTLCVEGDGCALNQLVQYAALPKQTVNSALRKLEEGKIITLTLNGKRKKNVNLTKLGQELCLKTVIKVIELENSIFLLWGGEKSDRYIEETREYNNLMQEGLNNICKSN